MQTRSCDRNTLRISGHSKTYTSLRQRHRTSIGSETQRWSTSRRLAKLSSSWITKTIISTCLVLTHHRSWRLSTYREDKWTAPSLQTTKSLSAAVIDASLSITNSAWNFSRHWKFLKVSIACAHSTTFRKLVSEWQTAMWWSLGKMRTTWKMKH